MEQLSSAGLGWSLVLLRYRYTVAKLPKRIGFHLWHTVALWGLEHTPVVSLQWRDQLLIFRNHAKVVSKSSLLFV